MNIDIKNTINNFLYNISLAEKDLSKFSEEISNKDKNIHEIINGFNMFINNIKIDEENNEFNMQLQETLNQYKAKSEIWNSLTSTYMNGKEFINQFEKSLLFVVFGNVNVGKSSIGNFLAGVPEELKDYYNQIPDFYVYDCANNDEKAVAKKTHNKGFGENDTEETISIQYYTLNKGLTWVDSPGIHSINGENEDLAKKYVDYADLVIFVMSSSSPAKYDEFLEVSRLIKKQKPLLVVINKSDKKDVDEIDNKIVEMLVPKSESDRKKQEDYVRDIFANNPSIKYAKSMDSISTSTRLAKVALIEDDNNKFILSGMPKFYDKLGEVLKNNAFELKKKAPIQRVNVLIDDLLNGFILQEQPIDGISNMKDSFNEILEEIDKKINVVNGLKKNIIKEIRIKSIPDIDITISKLGGALQCGNNINVNDVKNNIEAIIINNFNIILQKHISKVLSDFKHDNIKKLKLNINTEIKAKYETVTYTEYSMKEVSRDPRGVIEHIGSWFGKKYSKIKTSSHQVDKQVIVGDNSGEIIENIISNLENELLPIAEATLNEIATSYFKVEKISVISIIEKLVDIEKKLALEKIKEN